MLSHSNSLTEIPLPFGFTEQKIKGSVLKFMALNASVEQLVACGLSEIGLQLEFQRLVREIALQKGDTGTEILTGNSSSSGGSMDSFKLKTVKPTRNALKSMSELDRKIYKAK